MAVQFIDAAGPVTAAVKPVVEILDTETGAGLETPTAFAVTTGVAPNVAANETGV
jgi:hypothetical protein